MLYKELEKLYSAINNKPNSPKGIEYSARVQALRELKRYYAPQERSFGRKLEHDTFWGIQELLDSITPQENITSRDLEEYYRGLPTSAESSFAPRANQILRWLEHNGKRMESSWKTCPYRDVSAITQTSFEVDGQSYIFGAIGSSGAHEFFNLPIHEEIRYAQEVILEALIVRRFPIHNFKENDLVKKIREIAEFVIIERRKNNVYAWSPNCRDLNTLGNEGANMIALHFGVVLDRSEGYCTCLMHRYNPQYKEQYDAQGLPLPGSLGRRNCPSTCAETQAMFRTQFAQMIPMLLGLPEVYALHVNEGKIKILNKEKKQIETIEIFFLRPNPRDNSLIFHQLILDKRIGLTPFHPQSDGKVPFILEHLRKNNISPEDYQTISIFEENEHVVIAVSNNGETTTGKDFLSKGKEILRIPFSSLRSLHTQKLSMDHLMCNALPCIHCLNTIRRYGVENLHMSEMNWDMKGDDGLVAEWLMQNFLGRLSVQRHIT